MAAQDKRFAREEWKQPPFDAIARAFMSGQQWWDEATHGVRGVSKHHEDQVAFVARQWLDMVSPSNFIATNPQVLRQTLMTGGANLLNGYLNWARDAVAVAGGGRPRGVEDFAPGRGVALTHAAGYCLGGTLLAIAAALPECPGVVRTLTLLAAQTDFSEPGELGLFMDESQVAFLEDLMTETGYLDGRRMAGVFQLINSKDLVWSKLVHEYLMGATTPMTALRAWNADATRMPARMHAEYLRHLYLRNDLAEGRYCCTSRDPVNLSRITLPMFVVATERDHVSPWASVYRIHQLVASDIDFVLSSGGHNVGIVNPPEGPDAHAVGSYRRAGNKSRKVPAEPGDWFAGAQRSRGSWWPAWSRWLREHSSGTVAARRVPDVGIDGRIASAPGAYVNEP
ncbi:alpha/beta hydrolase [Variovorax sp. YR216]|uniref:PHA/PHB synthase family protein n=1 Tax=Variovorax sp. YR216 TaxID=1882828 RepID=UPI0008941C2B|nr:alpha/beta fold hydrolase [Variovorax sp. YR216]SEB24379.1 polyhydroxyalkanoate synthase [Variovorax sp. YR216]